MITRTDRRHAVLPTSAVFVGLIAAALRTALLLKLKITPYESDPSYYYLKFGGANALFAATLAVACAALLLAAAHVSKNADVQTSYMTAVAKTASVAFGIITAVCTVLYVFGTRDISIAFAAVLLLLALAVCARMIALPLGKIRLRSDVCAYLGMAAAVYYAVRILCDFVGQVASPLDMSGAYHFIMLITLMLFFLQETRVSLSRAKNMQYFAFGLLSLIFVPVYALPASVLYFTNGIGTFSQAVISFSDIVICVYIYARLCRALVKNQDA